MLIGVVVVHFRWLTSGLFFPAISSFPPSHPCHHATRVQPCLILVILGIDNPRTPKLPLVPCSMHAPTLLSSRPPPSPPSPSPCSPSMLLAAAAAAAAAATCAAPARWSLQRQPPSFSCCFFFFSLHPLPPGHFHRASLATALPPLPRPAHTRCVPDLQLESVCSSRGEDQ